MSRLPLIKLGCFLFGISCVVACSTGQLEEGVLQDGQEPETTGSAEFLEELEPTDTSVDSLVKDSQVREKESERRPLEVTIENLKSDTATVEMSIYPSEESFLVKKAQLKKFRVKPVDGRVKIKITEVPYGEFAIAIYQDLDENNEINRNMIGMPSEPYAFSNNVRPKLKLPSFDDCKFDYSDSAHSISISLIH